MAALCCMRFVRLGERERSGPRSRRRDSSAAPTSRRSPTTICPSHAGSPSRARSTVRWPSRPRAPACRRSAVLEMVRAFKATLDLDEDLINGDSFTVSYRQEYTLEGHPIGVAQVMWATLSTAARGTLSVHRFRAGRARQERLWLANGEAAVPAGMRWPLDEINVSSGFGLRADPLGRPRPMQAAGEAGRHGGQGQEQKKTASGGPVRPGPIARRALLMHQGVDFAAETGTPIHAAAAGTVTGARPNGGYGNWIEIQHDDGLEDGLRPSLGLRPRPPRRRLGGTRPAHRLRRHHRPLERPAPALRAASQWRADQSRRASGGQAAADAGWRSGAVSAAGGAGISKKRGATAVSVRPSRPG